MGEGLGRWRQYSLLLGGIGVSYFGNWIYLIALNILVLNMTNSAAAVAGLYMIGPIAKLFTNLWAGSVIDRMNKRKIMIAADVIRGVLIFLIPLMSSIWAVYAIVFVCSLASAFFGPSSTFYITKFVAIEERRRFNSIMSMMNSGSFLLGPAIAGVLIILIGTGWCVIINAVSFLICAFLIGMLPDVSDENAAKREPIRLKMIIEDWKLVQQFMLRSRYFVKIYLLYQIAIMIFFALDSQEVTFIKQNLHLNDQLYGVIVSVAGIGALLGASASAIWVKQFSLQTYIAVGLLFTTIGYTMFYSASGFWFATISFILLGFFMSFSNTGYATFYQNNVPTSIMGRFGSMEGMFQSIVQIMATFALGTLAEWFDLQLVTIIFSVVSIVIAIVLSFHIFDKSKRAHYEEGQMSI
ncbi:MFS transporter [Paenibacillus assamensis]|uniref:MFS transporter n=1 Tax=Paenibacillus assamensis TaxID=311244 RepID=UPI0003F55C8B|nr:MFS transporter [Paenibacillus assamensis]